MSKVMLRNTCVIRFTNTTKPKTKLPKSLLIFFLISQFFFGISFGFTPILKKKYRFFAHHFSIGISVFHILNIAATFLYIPYPPDLNIWLDLIEYFAYFIVLNSLKYTAYNFLCDMHELYKFKKSEKIIVNLIALVYVTIMFLVKTIMNTVDCLLVEHSYCEEYNHFHLILSSIPELGMDILAVTQILIYYYFHCYAKHLKELLASSARNVNVVEKRYIAVAACYDKIRDLYDKMTVLELFIGVPRFMIVLWWMLLHMTKNYSLITIVTEMIFASHIAIQIALPAITAEMLNVQIDAIKDLLTEYLRSETDENLKADLSRVSVYIERRPLRHLVLRFIPTDLRQILSVISLCTTYFIVLIQFTHVVD